VVKQQGTVPSAASVVEEDVYSPMMTDRSTMKQRRHSMSTRMLWPTECLVHADGGETGMLHLMT